MSNSTHPPVRTRIAPSPTGLPHVGTMRNALYSWLLARRHGGQFLFRLEDTDRDRYDARSEAVLYEAFRWLGLDYDEGPDIGGPYGPYVQSQRLPLYREAADQLIANGHAYPCFCSRERITEVRELRQKANIHPHGYDRHCRDLSAEERERMLTAGTPHIVRFAIPTEGQTTFRDEVRGDITYNNRELDDHVLLKSDGFPTYHLAHTVDDHHMRITDVIRSEEWLPSTPRHVLQYRALGWQEPRYIHPPLIMGRDPQSGKVSKLSKRHGSVHVGEYQDQGFLPEALANFIALLGWSPGGDREVMSREEMTALFATEGVNGSPSVFDPEKLSWMNGVYIRALSVEELTDRSLPFMAAAGVLPEAPTTDQIAYLRQVLSLEHERLKTLGEIPHATAFFFGELPEYDSAAVTKWLTKPHSGAALDALLRQFGAVPEWTSALLDAAVTAAGEELGVKRGEVIHPTRVSSTGRTVGPSLFDTLELLGRERVLARITHARRNLVPAS